MKKIIASLLVLFIFMISVPLTAEAAHCPRRRSARRSYSSRNYAARSYEPRYTTYRTAGYAAQRPSFYRRHRNLINLGAATGGGALIGALLGGKRGALLGTAIGAGSGALYTYGINKKRRRY